jgi:hypothetical protein
LVLALALLPLRTAALSALAPCAAAHRRACQLRADLELYAAGGASKGRALLLGACARPAR